MNHEYDEYMGRHGQEWQFTNAGDSSSCLYKKSLAREIQRIREEEKNAKIKRRRPRGTTRRGRSTFESEERDKTILV
jgi:hypothetical protein